MLETVLSIHFPCQSSGHQQTELCCFFSSCDFDFFVSCLVAVASSVQSWIEATRADLLALLLVFGRKHHMKSALPFCRWRLWGWGSCRPSLDCQDFRISMMNILRCLFWIFWGDTVVFIFSLFGEFHWFFSKVGPTLCSWDKPCLPWYLVLLIDYWFPAVSLRNFASVSCEGYWYSCNMFVWFGVSREFWPQNELGVFSFTILE